MRLLHIQCDAGDEVIIASYSHNKCSTESINEIHHLGAARVEVWSFLRDFMIGYGHMLTKYISTY